MTTIHESIDNLLHQISQNSYDDAEATFNQIMADKVNAAIENLKVDTADEMFNYQGAISESESSQDSLKDN